VSNAIQCHASGTSLERWFWKAVLHDNLLILVLLVGKTRTGNADTIAIKNSRGIFMDLLEGGIGFSYHAVLKTRFERIFQKKALMDMLAFLCDFSLCSYVIVIN
jgi:hypothetical protein